MVEQGEETSNFKTNLISSLFGQQIVAGIRKDDQTPSKIDTNYHCPHPIFIRKSCTKCGQEIDFDEIPRKPFSYIYPNLSLSLQEINRSRDDNLQCLLTRKKLHLIMDLDHTLLHQRPNYKLTPEDKKFLKSQKHGVDRNLIEGGSLINVSYGWVKLRPFVWTFLEEVSTMFDMTVYTLGGRAITRELAMLIDPRGVYFDNWRVISSDDYCGMLDKNKKSLDLVLEHERAVVVLDDNETVWEEFKGNYVRVVPYNFFHYCSPEDKERDASPPRLSWSQLGGDESEENGVLAKVLEKLRMIHAGFYDNDCGEYSSRDVREVIQRVEQKCQKSGKKQHHQKKKKMGRAVRS